MVPKSSTIKGKALGEYRAKRSAGRTPEPFPPLNDAPRSGLFVVQKHAARRMHYDLRLEVGGVLKSWAVPKGPSLDPGVKRLAVAVEDHPLEYGDFEGVIPAGNYGAGAVILWDRGRWICDGDPEEGIAKGKLLFELKGYKLRGVWTLFRTRAEQDWLLVKKPDAYASSEGGLVEESILSGLSVEELRDDVKPAKKIRAALERLRVPKRDVRVKAVAPMLAESTDAPFTDPAWLFEVKYDGFRLLAARGDRHAVLRYRRGSEATRTFPEIARAVQALPLDGLVLDGEVVVLDEAGRPSFQLLQQRFRLARPTDVRIASVRSPATYFVFDLLAVEGHDLRSLPLLERKKLLRQALPAAGALRYSDHFSERGEELFEQVRRMGLEGIVAKRSDSLYRQGRSSDWLKIRADRAADFVVVGHTAPKRGRPGFGALHLAVRDDDGGLTYAGRVGTGFRETQLRELSDWLEKHGREAPPCGGPVPEGAEHAWVAPELVCEVRYKQWTRDGLLRQPVFLRLRDDKAPEECDRPRDVRHAPALPTAPAAAVRPSARKVGLTNVGKVFWPGRGYTKGDLIDYYRSVASWILPYLADRPLVLDRYPDGIEGKSFFQKDAPGYVPDWIRIETMWSEHGRREIRYFVCEDVESLVYVANMGTIPLHVWSSRVSSIQHPDWCVIDLDPKDAPFEHVVRVAREIRSLCVAIELDCHVKTSGSSGLHVLVPLGRQCTYEQSRGLGQLLSRVVVSRLPEIATTARTISARGGRVYLDYAQNGHGRLLVAPFSVRPLPGAPVSTPLRWSEVNKKLDTLRFSLESVPARARRMRSDPLRPVLDRVPDLTGALARLGELLDAEPPRRPKRRKEKR